MLQGSWFNAAVVAVPGVKATHEAQAQKPLRFIRLVSPGRSPVYVTWTEHQSFDRKTLAWADVATRPAMNPSFDELRERSERTITIVPHLAYRS